MHQAATQRLVQLANHEMMTLKRRINVVCYYQRQYAALKMRLHDRGVFRYSVNNQVRPLVLICSRCRHLANPAADDSNRDEIALNI